MGLFSNFFYAMVFHILIANAVDFKDVQQHFDDTKCITGIVMDNVAGVGNFSEGNHMLHDQNTYTALQNINDIARYNKIAVKYEMKRMEGPDHQRRYTVSLKLGEEQYEAHGWNLKMAKRMAASYALDKTAYKKAPRMKKKNGMRIMDVDPTAALTNYGLKYSWKPIYHTIYDPLKNDVMAEEGCSDMKNIFIGPQHCSATYKISLSVNDATFFGKGLSEVSAKREAASEALDYFRRRNVGGKWRREELNPVSAVYEIAQKWKFEITFDVIDGREFGQFETVARLGTKDHVVVSATAKAQSRKDSKRLAAVKLLESVDNMAEKWKKELNDKRKMKKNKKKRAKNIDKSNVEVVRKVNSPFPNKVNAISELKMLRDFTKSGEINYMLQNETFLPDGSREFSMLVSMNNVASVGTGKTKKDAKLNAADLLLRKLGFRKEKEPRIVPVITDNWAAYDYVLENKEGLRDPAKTVPGVVIIPLPYNAYKKSIGDDIMRYFNPADKSTSCEQLTMYANASLVFFKFSDHEPSFASSRYFSILSFQDSFLCIGTGETKEEAHNDASYNAMTHLYLEYKKDM